MRRLWLIFAQAVTVAVAVVFVMRTFGEWPGTGAKEVAIQQAAAPIANDRHDVASYNVAAQRALPSVVHIFTTQEVRAPRNPLLNDPFFRHFFGDRYGEQSQRRSGLGSGVIVSADGFILTNNHVVESADQIEVAIHDGRKFKATVVGADPESDLAVVRIQADGKLQPITFAQPRSLKIGDVVLAIGNPFGVGQTVTAGIVSALDRSQLGINTFENFIQTDAAINPGNSGGALVDSNGALVGINAAISSQTGSFVGIGFAIPVSLAQDVFEQIVKTGSVTRGWVGVEIQEITQELADSFKLPDARGVLIAGVVRGSPAERAGIKTGDVLLAIDSKPVGNAHDMLDMIAALMPGDPSKFKLRRDGREIDLSVTVGRRPKPQPRA